MSWISSRTSVEIAGRPGLPLWTTPARLLGRLRDAGLERIPKAIDVLAENLAHQRSGLVVVGSKETAHQTNPPEAESVLDKHLRGDRPDREPVSYHPARPKC